MQEIEMNGIIYEFPDNMNDDDIRKALSSIGGTQKQGYTIDDAMRSLGLGTRDVLTGLGSITEPIIQPINAINEALGGQPNYFATNAGESISNALNLPTSQTKGENIASMAIQGGASAIPFMGAGQLLAKSASPVVSGVGATLQEQPVMQGISSVTGGGAVGGAQNADLGATGQLVAGLAGALVPSSAMGLSAIPTSYAQSFSKSYPQRKAGTLLENIVKDKDLVAKQIEEAYKNGNFLEGSNPTLGQITQDPQIAVLEKTLRNKGIQGADISERYVEQANAMRNAVNQLRNSGVDELQAGTLLREQVDPAYQQAKEQTGQAYSNVDPRGTANFSIEQLQGLFAETLKNISERSLPSEIKNIMLDLKDYIDDGIALDYPRIQDIRTDLGDLIREASRGTVKLKIGRLASIMQKQLDDFMEHSGELDYEALQQAKQARISQGQRFEQGAVEPLTRSGKKTGAEAIADSEIIRRFTSQTPQGQQNVQQLLSASDTPQTRALVLDKIIENGIKKSTNKESFDVEAFNAYLYENRNTIDLLDPTLRARLQEGTPTQGTSLESSFYSDDKVDLMNTMRADQRRMAEQRRLADTAGSQTAQLQEAMDSLGMLSQPRVQENGFWTRLAGGLMDKVFRDKNRVASEELTNAILDPQYALKLMGQSYNKTNGFNNMVGQGGFGIIDPFANMLNKFGVPTANTMSRTPLQIETKEE